MLLIIDQTLRGERDILSRYRDIPLYTHESSIAQVVQGLADFFLGVHYKWSVGDDRLSEGRASHQHEAYFGGRGSLDAQMVAIGKDCHAHSLNYLTLTGTVHAKAAFPLVYVGNSRMPGRNR